MKKIKEQHIPSEVDSVKYNKIYEILQQHESEVRINGIAKSAIMPQNYPDLIYAIMDMDRDSDIGSEIGSPLNEEVVRIKNLMNLKGVISEQDMYTDDQITQTFDNDNVQNSEPEFEDNYEITNDDLINQSTETIEIYKEMLEKGGSDAPNSEFLESEIKHHMDVLNYLRKSGGGF